MTAATHVEPVVKEIEVSVPPPDAFRVFTEGLPEWWPVMTHSIGEGQVEQLVVEAREGGRIRELWSDGTEYDWARFIAWEPPERFVMTWRPRPDPGPTTEVEVTFEASSAGTRVRLVHRGWERLGDVATEARRNYDSGWIPVLDRFVEAVT